MAARGGIVYGDPVRRGDPLARRLVWAWLPLSGRGTGVDDLTGTHPRPAVAAAPGWAPGDGPVLNGSTQYVDTGRTVAQLFGGSAPAGLSVTWRMRPDTAHNSGAIRGIWGALNSASVPEFTAQVYSDNNWYVGFNAGGDDDRVTLAASAANYPQGVWAWYSFVTTIGGSSYLYKDGAEFGSKTSGASTYQTPADTFTFGRQGASGVTYFPGGIGGLLLHDRALAADEVARLHADPYRLLRRSDRLSWRAGPPAAPATGSVFQFQAGLGW